MLSPDSLPRLQHALRDAGLDGWLLYDFHGANPIATGLLGLSGLLTRRYFVLIPREGAPVAVTHNIEQGPWREWPSGWGRERYSTWRALEASLARLVRGKRIAMEYSPGDAVPPHYATGFPSESGARPAGEVAGFPVPSPCARESP